MKHFSYLVFGEPKHFVMEPNTHQQQELKQPEIQTGVHAQPQPEVHLDSHDEFHGIQIDTSNVVSHPEPHPDVDRDLQGGREVHFEPQDLEAAHFQEGSLLNPAQGFGRTEIPVPFDNRQFFQFNQGTIKK